MINLFKNKVTSKEEYLKELAKLLAFTFAIAILCVWVGAVLDRIINIFRHGMYGSYYFNIIGSIPFFEPLRLYRLGIISKVLVLLALFWCLNVYIAHTSQMLIKKFPFTEHQKKIILFLYLPFVYLVIKQLPTLIVPYLNWYISYIIAGGIYLALAMFVSFYRPASE